MQYDPVKKKLGKIIGSSVLLRKLFYSLLNILLLRTWHIRKEIKKFRKKTGKANNINVLDAGCGFGQYSCHIAKKNPNWQIHGIDIKADEISDCKSFFYKTNIKNTSFEIADLTTFKNVSSYDLILSVDVMEHIEDDMTVFRNFFDSLKNNGMLLISTPSDLGGSDVKNHGDNSFIEEHVRDGYSKEDISTKLNNVGFKKVETYYSYGKYGNISWQFSMKYPLLMAKYKFLLPLIAVYYVIFMPFCLLLNYIDTKIDNKTGTGLIVKAYK